MDITIGPRDLARALGARLAMPGAALVAVASIAVSTYLVVRPTVGPEVPWGFPVTVTTIALVLVGAAAAVAPVRRQLARLWRSILVGALWMAVCGLAGLGVGLASTLFAAGEITLLLAVSGVLLGPCAATLGAARSCKNRISDHAPTVYATAVLAGGLGTAAWRLGVGLAWPFGALVLVNLVAPVLTTVGAAVAAAVCEARVRRGDPDPASGAVGRDPERP